MQHLLVDLYQVCLNDVLGVLLLGSQVPTLCNHIDLGIVKEE